MSQAATPDPDSDEPEESDVMEPVAVERGLPAINDFIERLGKFLNR